MRRREFIAFLGGSATAPFAARAQQGKLPLIGYLSFTAPDERPTLLSAFLEGLEQAGFSPGRNVTIEYRSAAGHYDQLPALAAELVQLPANVIAATGGEAVVRAAKGATLQTPIVFTIGIDPVEAGLVESLNRPGGNTTGVSLLGYELDAKRLQLLHELLPKAKTIGVLANVKSPSVQRALPGMNTAADSLGQRLVLFDVGTEAELQSAFASLQSQHIDALLVTTNPYFEGRREQIVALAENSAIPVLYPWREYAAIGGLISYGTSFEESYRQAGL
jgi:putative ABC transport system substrate-binding protein